MACRERESDFNNEIDRRLGNSRLESSRLEIEEVEQIKTPFFDRDLENFKRLHADGAISVGVIVTRGRMLQEKMRILVRRFVDDRKIGSVYRRAESLGL